jgi:hypothetical protein
MKTVILTLLSLTISACASTQKTRLEWQDRSGQVATISPEFQSKADSCDDFAYKARVAGTKYTHWDLFASCLERKGYILKEVAL